MTKTRGADEGGAIEAGIYCRISSDPTGLRAGVERQEADCRALAEREGWEVARVFVDNDTSAYSGKPRPEYLRLMDAIRGGLGAVVAWHPDRLHRSPRELEEFIDLVAGHGTLLATVQTGAWDLTTPSGRMVARQLGAVARYESEHKSERIRRKMRDIAERGDVGGGGTRPFGFEDDRVTIRDDEATLIRGAVEHVRTGGAIRAIARDWTERGVPTISGKPWSTTVIRRLLMSPRIAGMREHRGTIVGEAVWPAIVDRDAWGEARAILGTRKRQGRPRRYLLTGGIAVCGLCTASLVARPRGDGARCYVCATGPDHKGCGKIRALAEPLEADVAGVVLTLLRGPVLADILRHRAGDDAGARRLTEELRGYEQRLDTLTDAHFIEGAITRDEYDRLRAGLVERIEAGRARLARRSPEPLDLPDPGQTVREWWDGAGIDARRAMIRLVLARVVVNPARRGYNKFDPSRLEYHVRDEVGLILTPDTTDTTGGEP